MAFTKVVGPGIHTQSQLRTHNIHSSGIITATKFIGPLEASSGSSGTFDSLTVTGNVSIGGTLQYEDVTNVESVGIITAKEGIFLPDSKELKLGNTATSPDVKLYSTGTNGWLYTPQSGADLYMGTNAGEVYIQTGSGGNDTALKVNSGGSVEINHSTNKKLETTSTGAVVTGILTATSAVINEDNAIHFKGTAADDDDAILRASAGGGQLLINSRNDTILNIDSNGDGTDAHFAVAHGAATGSSTELFRVQENGQIGIGTVDPAKQVHIEGAEPFLRLENTHTGSKRLDLRVEDSDNNAYIAASQSGQYLKLYGRSGFTIATDNETSERLRITDDGKVKIDVPTAKIGITTGNLDVWGDGTLYPTLRLGSLDLNEEGEHIRFGRKDISADIRYHSIWGRNSATSGSNYLAFKLHDGSGSPFTGQTEILRLTGDSRVGINESSPDAPLHITGGLPHILLENSGTSASAGDILGQIEFKHNDSDDAGVTAAIKCVAEDAAGNSYLAFHNGDGGNTPENFRITSDGYIKYTGVREGDETNKLGRLIAPSHDTNEEDVMYMQIQQEDTFNQLELGGGSSSYNAATKIMFRTAAIDTVTGANRLEIDSSGQSTFDKGAPNSADQVIARFQCESSRKLDVVWHDTGSKMGFNTPGNHDYTFKCNDTERLTLGASSALIQVNGTFQVNNFQVRDAGFSGTWNTGISVNAGNAGACMIFLCCRNWDANDSTHAGVYIVRLGYSGGQEPGVTHISGNNSWTIDRNTTDDTVQINGGSGNQRVCILWTT